MKKLWKQLTPSDYAWERDALAWLREQLPDHEPYRAWANFEFIAPDGSINEVDLLVVTPKGCFLVEIKSRPGEITGDAGTWHWTHGNRCLVIDNPRILAERKAKKLASLLKAQRSVSRGKERLPYIETLVFLSAADLVNRLTGPARIGVHQRDRTATDDQPERPGILHALMQLDAGSRRIDRPVARLIARALDEAGIREAAGLRRVGPYQLGELLDESDRFQEWAAEHVEAGVHRRIRLYLTHGKPAAEATRLQRAARREFQFLDGLEHPGLLRPLEYHSHELGPALVFEHEPDARRLDHFLAARANGQPLPIELALHLLRSIAEVVAYAHEHRLFHRALCPQSVLVLHPDSAQPTVKLFSWATATRQDAADRERLSSPSHLSDLVQDEAGPYRALESHSDPQADATALDVFSLGAIAYHLFTGRRPAESDLELQDKLRENRGLQVTDVLDGATPALQDLVWYATHVDADARLDSARTFLEYLDLVEDELTRPEDHRIDRPTEARAGDLLAGGYRVRRRLGRGASAITFLVEKDGREQVLKLAGEPDHNRRLQEEAETLGKLRHPAIVDYHGSIELAGHTGLLLDYAGEGTLAERLRQQGALHLELLERFGDDLLSAVAHLEERGLRHRDIKPENIGLLKTGTNRLRLVLFDFSLSRVPADNFTAGTAAYLDPFIRDPDRRRWDDYAERFAAALTLYEMTTGSLPNWTGADGLPPLIAGELAIDDSRFDPAVREAMAAFFCQALARDIRRRFDNAGDMLRAWRDLFVHARSAAPVATQAPATITLDTQIGLLEFSSQALATLTRLNINTVAELLALPLNELVRMSGVGNRTRREISDRVRQLREQLPEAAEPTPPAGDAERPSIDRLLDRLLPGRDGDAERRRLLGVYLGGPPRGCPAAEDADTATVSTWPTASEAAAALGLSREQVEEWLDKALNQWSRTPALTVLRNDIIERLDDYGGVLTADELAEALLLQRGSVQASPRREQWAGALARAALETELRRQSPRCILRRNGGKLIIADDRKGTGEKLADHAATLGRIADDCANRDPLLAPQRALQRLLAIEPPAGANFGSHRLLRLAAACAQQAALSSRAEFYPRGMDARRALQLAQGALLGARLLGIDELRARVRGRYPEARPLPGRPQLDAWLRELDLGFDWDGSYRWEDGRRGAYRQPTRAGGSRFSSSYHASTGETAEIDAETVPARLRAELDRVRQGGFLALSVAPRWMEAAAERLCREHALQRVSFDELLLRQLHRVCETMKRPPRWEVVLAADAAEPGSRDWINLQKLIARALPAMREELLRAERTVLLTEPGLLARYRLIDGWLQELRDALSADHPGLVLLIATPGHRTGALIDQSSVPVGTGVGAHVRIPGAWLDDAA